MRWDLKGQILRDTFGRFFVEFFRVTLVAVHFSATTQSRKCPSLNVRLAFFFQLVPK